MVKYSSGWLICMRSHFLPYSSLSCFSLYVFTSPLVRNSKAHNILVAVCLIYTCEDWRRQGLFCIGKCGTKEVVSEEEGKSKAIEWMIAANAECFSPANEWITYCFQISKVTEMSLSANQERSEMEKKRLVWKVEGSAAKDPKVVRGGPVDPAKLLVELAPMEIRTFLIDFDYLHMYGSWRKWRFGPFPRVLQFARELRYWAGPSSVSFRETLGGGCW